MIIHTRRDFNAMLARVRRGTAAQLADVLEATLPDPCPHNNRPSCPRCAERRTMQAAAKLVRETGGAT